MFDHLSTEQLVDLAAAQPETLTRALGRRLDMTFYQLNAYKRMVGLPLDRAQPQPTTTQQD
jgi:hypothetical protein